MSNSSKFDPSNNDPTQDPQYIAWANEIGERIHSIETGEDFVKFLEWFEYTFLVKEDEPPFQLTRVFISGLLRMLTHVGTDYRDMNTGNFPDKPSWRWLARLFVESFYHA
jgi:hypothetical protein